MSSTLTVDPRAGGEPQPFIANDIGIEINGVDIHCLASHVEIAPDTNTTDVTTFCGVQTFPGSVTWHFRATLYLSYDADGTDDLLCGIWDAYETDGSRPTFTVKPFQGRPTGPGNPEFSGTLIPQDYPLIVADAGEAPTIDLDWTCVGKPTRTPPCATARTPASSPGTAQPAAAVA